MRSYWDPKIERTCETCKEPFEFDRFQHGPTPKYCSNKCKQAAYRRRVGLSKRATQIHRRKYPPFRDSDLR